MVDYSERLKEAMKDEGVKIPALATALKISYQAVRKVLQGGQFNAENNALAAKKLKVNSDWLATGRGPKRSGESQGADASAPVSKYAPLLRDLEDIPPGGRRDALFDAIQEAAAQARAAHAHLTARNGKQAQLSKENVTLKPGLTSAQRVRVDVLRQERQPQPPSSPNQRREEE